MVPLGFCIHGRSTCAFAGQQCAPMQLFASTVFIPSLLLGQDLSPLLFQLSLPLSSISVLYSLLLPDTLVNVTLVNPACAALKPETMPWLFSFIYYLSGRLLKAMISVWHEAWIAHKAAQFRHAPAQEHCDDRGAVSQVGKAVCGKGKVQELCPGSASVVLRSCWIWEGLIAFTLKTGGRNKQNTPVMAICYYLNQ